MNESDTTLDQQREHNAERKDDLAFQTWLQVIKTYQVCHNSLGQELKDLDLSVAQHDVLANINYAGSLSQQELADKLLVVKSNITALLNRLEKRNLVRRIADPKDARSKRVSLTKEGKNVIKTSLERQDRVVEKMSNVLSQQDMQALSKMMQDIRAELKK